MDTHDATEGNVKSSGIPFWQQKWLRMQPRKPKPLLENLERDLERGWLLPYLTSLDDLTWGRWNYWARCQMGAGALPDETIPQIDFCSHGEAAAHSRKMLERALSAIPTHGCWMGWSSSEYFDYFLSWLLFGFGHDGHAELPQEPGGCEGASMRLYQVFDLSPLLLWPYDHLAEIFSESKYGQGAAFFPTPMHICEMMARMTMGEGDHRTESVYDPCVGTGRMLLAASNYSLRLYAQDILRMMCKATLVNAYLYAPWLALPIGWLDNVTVRAGNALLMEPGEAMNGYGAEEDAAQAVEQATEVLQERSETMCAQSPPHYQAQLFDSEFDADGTRETFPVLKRRKRASGSTPAGAGQMNLLEV
jgi:hypothetical protein